MRRLPLRSPPRVRGKVCHTMAEAKGLGITPAYAGKSPPAKRRNPAIWDHPRVCGEKWQNRVNQLLVRGSPPRMRGKGRRNHPVIFVDGITPAYAGKSLCQLSYARAYRDHPRVCGEKKSRRCCTSIGLGSPPRVRGKAAFDTGHRQVEGITPAYAGKSCSNAPKNRTTWDHPRVCGEKHLPAAAMQGCPGITPACAGKRRSVAAAARSRRDHPRVCGEKAPE